ncbi:MAG: ATP-binding cassette domain-containing protein, partial [Candidatus Micrarchaeaceae archaeon]
MLIEAVELSKTFKRSGAGVTASPSSKSHALNSAFWAVTSVSFSCAPGEVLGLLGPNGAGKTTTLRMLSTAINPTAGSVLIDGRPLRQEDFTLRKRIGFLSGNTGLYNRLTVKENLLYFGRAYRIPPSVLNRRVSGLLDILNLGDYSNILV